MVWVFWLWFIMPPLSSTALPFNGNGPASALKVMPPIGLPTGRSFVTASCVEPSNDQAGRLAATAGVTCVPVPRAE